MDTRSVLDLSEVRPPFLVDLLHPRPGQTQADDRAGVLTIFHQLAMPRFELDDDVDDDFDEDEDSDQDDEESDEDGDEEDDPEDDVETWQVGAEMPLKVSLRLTFGHRTA
jgi:hypothetical protein